MKKILIILLAFLLIAQFVSASEYNGTLSNGNGQSNQQDGDYGDSLSNSFNLGNNLTIFVKYANGHSCSASNQCVSNICCSAICSSVCSIAPTCSDGIQNQGETGVDCGGSCSACSSGSSSSSSNHNYRSSSSSQINNNLPTNLGSNENTAPISLVGSRITGAVTGLNKIGAFGIVSLLTILLTLALLLLLIKMRKKSELLK